MTDEEDLGLSDADVPDLIGALADRMRGYDFTPRQAVHIAAEMLAEAMTTDDPADETLH